MAKRTKLSENTEAEVLFNSDRKCCVCRGRGDQIHHIDSNPSNNSINNLALLCFDCHNEASVTNSLRKKLSAKTIVKYREEHYSAIKSQRESSRKLVGKKITTLSSDDLVEASKTAIMLLEISRIKNEYIESRWSDREKSLNKLNFFVEHINPRISYEVLNFLNYAVETTRNNMPKDIAFSIYCLVTSFFPSSFDLRKNKENKVLGRICCYTALSMTYDAFIYLNNIEIAQYGLLMLKYVNIYAKRVHLSFLQEKVQEIYDQLESTLMRPERTDLEHAKELVKIYREDLSNNDISYPILPDHLMQLMK